MRSAKSSKKAQTKSPIKRVNGRDTITFADLKKLSFIDSPILERAVEINGKRHQWVGTGFVNEDELEGDEILVVED
jgi:hypothetical protein